MQITLQLISLRQLHQRLLLKDGVIPLDQFKNSWLKHHIACIDRGTVLHCFFAESMHGIIQSDIQDPLLLLLHDGSKRGNSPMFPVKAN